MFAGFLPNKEKPDIRPMTTRLIPFRGSREARRTRMEMAVTKAELTRAGPGPDTRI